MRRTRLQGDVVAGEPGRPLGQLRFCRAHRPGQGQPRIFWLKDESLSDFDDMPALGVIAAEIVEDLEAALEQSREIALDLGGIKAEEIA